MTILEKWQKAQTEMDEAEMEKCLHDNFKFMNYSQNKEFSKRDVINWILSGDIRREKIRILYENNEVAVEHSLSQKYLLLNKNPASAGFLFLPITSKFVL